MAFRNPADPNALVYVAFNGHVIALRPDNGERVWSHDGETGLSRVLVEGEFVYVLQSLSVVCLEAATGRLIWQAGCDAGYTLLVHGGRVFVGGHGAIRCFSAVDGTPLWSDGFKGLGLGAVAIAVDGASSQADN